MLKRSTRVLGGCVLVACIAALMVAASYMVVFHLYNPQWQPEFHPLQFRIGRFEDRVQVRFRPVVTSGPPAPEDRYISLTRGYHVGPVSFQYTTNLPKPVPLGMTNAVKDGDVIYSPEGGVTGWVKGYERVHDFDDGSERAGVLVLSTNGVEIWIPREKMQRALIGQ